MQLLIGCGLSTVRGTTMPHRALAIINEALALRASHPHAPAADVLDLAMQGHQFWLEDFFDHMVPPSPFALLVAEAVGDFMSTAEWKALTGASAAEKVRDAMHREYVNTVLPKFVKRYGFSYLGTEEPSVTVGGPRWL
jgi:hypothetical protein